MTKTEALKLIEDRLAEVEKKYQGPFSALPLKSALTGLIRAPQDVSVYAYREAYLDAQDLPGKAKATHTEAVRKIASVELMTLLESGCEVAFGRAQDIIRACSD